MENYNGILSNLMRFEPSAEEKEKARTMAMLRSGLGILAQGGPSTTPRSLGSIVGKAGMEGLDSYDSQLKGILEGKRNQINAVSGVQSIMARDAEMKSARLKAEEDARKAAFYSPQNRAQFMTPGAPPATAVDDDGNPNPAVAGKFDFPRFLEAGASQGIVNPETYANHLAQREQAKATLDANSTIARERIDAQKQIAADRIEANIEAARQRGADQQTLARMQIEGRASLAQLTAGLRAGSNAQPRPPSGYRYTNDGDLEAIPGGPKDMGPRNKAVAETANIKAKIVMDKVDEALKETGFFSTGLTGSVLGMVPGTGAYNLEATLDTIKANIGFNELQAMRQASPTGGALGSIAVRELDMLQAVLASLKKGQTQDKLVSGLNQVKQHYSNWKNAVDQSAVVEGGAPSNPQRRATDAPAGVSAAEWNAMTPAEKALWKK